MNSAEAPRVSKTLFLLGDFLLVGFAAFVILTASWPLNRWELAAAVLSMCVGCWLGCWPYQREHATALVLQEQAGLASATESLKNLESLTQRISQATSQWQGVQDVSAKTVASAGEISARMQAEAKAFTEFMTRADEHKMRTLQLESDKARRTEGEMLQVIVHLLDHTYGLLQAAMRTEQPALIQQLSQFRAACLDASRRVGVVAHEGKPGEAFDPKIHQSVHQGDAPVEGIIATTMACGYSYQGQGIRPILVALEGFPGPTEG